MNNLILIPNSILIIFYVSFFVCCTLCVNKFRLMNNRYHSHSLVIGFVNLVLSIYIIKIVCGYQGLLIMLLWEGETTSTVMG